MEHRISNRVLERGERREFQADLFGKSIMDRFDEWKMMPGAGKVLAKAYALAACFYRRYKSRGIGVSQRYIEEQLRDWIKLRVLISAPENGFAFNSHLTRPMVLHMIAHHPEWRGMFELREPKEKVIERKTVVITERVISGDRREEMAA